MHSLLAAIIDSIVEDQDSLCGSADNTDADKLLQGPFGSGRFLADWAFSVLAFVEEPLVDDIQFNLQRLRRACQKSIVTAHTLAEAGTREFDNIAHAQATLLLVIVTEHFGQR